MIFHARRLARRYPSLLRIARPVESRGFRDCWLGDFRMCSSFSIRSDNPTRTRIDIGDFDAFPTCRREIIVTIERVLGRRPDLEVRYAIIGFIVVGVVRLMCVCKRKKKINQFWRSLRGWCKGRRVQ
jgi:hypothetical protein